MKVAGETFSLKKEKRSRRGKIKKCPNFQVKIQS